MKKTLIVVQGPTGIGKTEVCLSMAEHFGIPVINADSRQIFAELPIGTAAPTLAQQARAKHYFVGNHHIEDYYNASMFEEDVTRLLGHLFQTSDYALMGGGSMMYIDAVCNGIDDIPTVDDETRTLMKQRLANEGLDALVAELKALDPEHWAIVDRHNPRRVVHALEICHMTGQTYTSFRKRITKDRPFNIIKIGLSMERAQLYSNINVRVLKMMEQGLLEEARTVFPKRHLNALNTVGYKELFAHFLGQMTLDEAIERIQGNTRRYCRKQQTWLKRDEKIRWFSPDNIKEIINYAEGYNAV